MKIKNILLLVCAIFLCADSTFAQNEVSEKEAKKVVIIKKTIDADGNKTVEETVLEGAEAADFELEEAGKRIIKIEEEEEISGQKTEKQVRIMKFDSDEGELTPEMIEKLKKEGIDIEEIMKTAEDKKGEDKIIFIDKGAQEMDIEKEIIIVDENGKKEKTKMRMKREMMDSVDGNTLAIKSININLDGNMLTINVSLPKAVTVVQLIDTDGKVIYKETVKKVAAQLDRVIDLEKAAQGPLFMIIKQGDKVFSERLVR